MLSKFLCGTAPARVNGLSIGVTVVLHKTIILVADFSLNEKIKKVEKEHMKKSKLPAYCLTHHGMVLHLYPYVKPRK